MDKFKPVLTKLSINKASIRKEMFDGRPHTVIPAVIAVAGVLNGAKVTAEELGRFPTSWDGRSIPLLHPEMNGEPVSANLPDVLQRAVGTVFNTYIDGEALKSEFWIDDEKMDRAGYSALLAQMVDGTALVEVSTAYFADTIANIGEFKGKRHEVEHRNLRPDHVALLPGQVGACSIEDGCGAPRVNKRNGGIKVKAKDLIEALRKGLGLKTNCGCDGSGINVLEVAETLKANGKLTAKQFEALQEMDEEQRGMVGAIMDAMTVADKAAAKAAKAKAAANAEGEEEEEEEEEVPPKKNKGGKTKNNSQQPQTFTLEDVDRIVAERMDRAEVKSKLLANSANAFSEEEIDAMPVASLKKYEQSIRPVDYSGQGGFSTHNNSGGARQSKGTPLLLNRGVLAAPAKEAAK